MKIRFLVLFLFGLDLQGVYAQTGQWDELLKVKNFTEIIHQGANIVPDTASTLVLCRLARAYEGVAKPREAYGLYKVCYERDSSDLELLFKLSELNRTMGNDKPAWNYLVRAQVCDSTNFYAKLQLAQVETRLKQYDSAVKRYQNLLTLDSLNPYLWYGLGECYTLKNEPIRAALAFLTAYDQNRDNETMAVRAISALIGREAGPANILNLCDTVLYYLPGNLHVLQLKGITLYNGKRYEEAERLFAEMLQAGDSSLVNMKYSGIISWRQKKYGEAVLRLQRVYGEDSLDMMVNLTLATSLVREHDIAGAFRLLDKVELDLQPDTVVLQLLTEYRGQAWQQAGNPQRAARYYYDLYKMDPRRLDMLDAIIRSFPHFSDVEEPRSREIILFTGVKLVKECLAMGMDPAMLTDYKALLTYFYEDMFFRGQKMVRMGSPDGKATDLSGTELMELILRIPDRE